MVLLAMSLARKYFNATVPDAIVATELADPVIEPMVGHFKTMFTNTLARFAQVNWSGRIEIDYVDPSVCDLKPEKAKTLSALHWDRESEMPTLVPHAHLVVIHPNVHRLTLAHHLQLTFPGSRRVQLRPFRVTCERTVALDRLARYPLKPPLHRLYLAGRNSKNHKPRHPDVVRYTERIREALDRPSRRRLLEFDKI